MTKYGVIGYPVKNSFSPAYFANKFKNLGLSDFDYQAYEIKSAEGLRAFFERENLSGVNVTMPIKQEVISYLDEISHSAVKINAVNTITFKNGKLYGDNTDHIGFGKSIIPLLNSGHKKALIFGTGGASLAVKFMLGQLGIPYAVVSRLAGVEFTYDSLNHDILKQYTILINSTPLGMQHRIDEAVNIPYDYIGERHLCYDLVYDPLETIFLKQCKSRGATIKGGLEMLELQADRSWEIWNM
ncbi:shikimate dehydrogenase [Bacteroidia bacterium]|nr:shikimate dehydrogenase [Bacteroidia bacterium]